MRRLLPFFICTLLILGCKSKELRDDPEESPVDTNIYQTRLEFSGCDKEIHVGSIVCFERHKTIKVRTEFTGEVSYISKGEGCDQAGTIKAVSPYTSIPLKQLTSGKICNISVLYQPRFVPEPEREIRGVFGSITQMYDANYLS